MNTLKNTAALGATVLLLSSTFANAATDLDAMQACSKEIANEIAKQQEGADPKVNIDRSGIDPKQRLNGITIFHVDARDPATDDVIGKFDCRVNRRGNVRSLLVLDLDAPPAMERSRG